MMEGNVFTLSTIWGGGYPVLGLWVGGRGVPHPRSGWGVPRPMSVGGGGYPIPGLCGGGRVPCPRSVVGGYPIPGLDGGGTWGTPPNQDWICYAAGGMPLAFTQEDFLVLELFTQNNDIPI